MIQTARLTLRRPRPEDAGAAVAFLTSPRARLMVGEMTEADARAEFAAVVAMWDWRGFGLFALTRRGTEQAIGLAGPYMPDSHPEPEIGWNLWDGLDEGQGLATEAARAARDWAFASQGWQTAVSYINHANHASQRLAMRLGAHLDPNAPCPYPPPVCIYRHSREAV